MKRFMGMILVFLIQGHVFAAISVDVSPSTVSLGESFRLLITMEDTQACGVPNLIPLQNDFTIEATERRMSYTVVNGQARSACQWTVTLSAKKSGLLPIPALQMGPGVSPESRIEVLGGKVSHKQDASSGAQDEELLLKTDVSPPTPFVSQQILYTVKLYNNQRLLDGAYQPPSVEDALMIPLGDVRRYQTTRNGREYAVEAQQYAVFPQKSGKLLINAPSFDALVYDRVPRRVHVHAKETSLPVKPMPQSYTGKQWLPAKQVTLSEQYDRAEDSFTEGDTLVRTVTLQAAAAPAQLIPALSFKSNPEFSVYPGAREEQNSVMGGDIVGRTTVKATYLLNKTGSITLPSIEVPWFNTATGREEIASLPEHTLTITPRPEASKAVSSSPSSSVLKPSTLPTPSEAIVPVLSATQSWLPWAIAIGFAVLWVVTLILWWLRYGFSNRRRKQCALKRLRAACLSSNAYQARRELLRWAALEWPDRASFNLNDVADAAHDAHFREVLNGLSQALYSPKEDKPWRGDGLWHCVAMHRAKRMDAKRNPRDLPPMNP